MTVVTISGGLGSGAREVARLVADELGIDYIDQTLLVEAAQRLGVSVEQVAGRDERTMSFGERLAGLLRGFLERSAVAGAADPMLGSSGLEGMLARSYEEESGTEPSISDKKYVRTLSVIIEGLAERGDVVILGRGSHVVLQQRPGALHVNLVCPRQVRAAHLADRDEIAIDEAERRIAESDRGRASFYRKLFGCEPEEPAMFHLTLNSGRMSHEAIGRTVIAALEAGAAAASV